MAMTFVNLKIVFVVIWHKCDCYYLCIEKHNHNLSHSDIMRACVHVIIIDVCTECVQFSIFLFYYSFIYRNEYLSSNANQTYF